MKANQSLMLYWPDDITLNLNVDFSPNSRRFHGYNKIGYDVNKNLRTLSTFQYAQLYMKCIEITQLA